MTPKEKAKEIFKKYYCMENNSSKRLKCIEFQTAKKCALISVDEIIDALEKNGSWNAKYWEEVKQEIENN